MKQNPIEKLYHSIERATRGKSPRDAEIEVLSKVLPYAWRRESSRPGRHDTWTPGNPAHGQSDATVLVVQDQIGGRIFRSDVPGYGTHYYNMTNDGTVRDFAKAKFPKGTVIPPGVEVTRDDLLASKEAQDSHLKSRYSYLTDRFDDVLRMLDRVHAGLHPSRPPGVPTPPPPHRP